MKKFSLITLSLMFAGMALAQKGGDLIFTVGNDSIWGAEFERVYSKNNKVDVNKPTEKDLQEYLDLYVKFKLKVKEAYALQMDTNTDYIKELAGYRKQLAQPYLTDQEITESLMEQAYSRMENEVRASNLMVHVSLSASPGDTLKAFNRIQKWRKMIVEGGYDFNKLAQDSSTDLSAKNNKGDLGYFTAFNMIYAFENQAYNNPVGGVSQAFRTQYGYHLLKVNDKRRSRGEVKVAHILIRVNNEGENETKKEKIDAIYKLLEDGGDWNDLVQRYTEDFGSRNRAGEINWIKSVGGGIPQEFKEVAFRLRNDNSYSKPVKTDMGWHIVKRLEHRPIKEYKELKQWLKFKINKDQRGKLSKNVMLVKLKRNNGFKEFSENLKWVEANMDSSVLENTWVPGEKFKRSDALFVIGEKTYTIDQFSQYMYTLQKSYGATSVPNFVQSAYGRYVEEMNISYEENVLEDKYPDFKYLMQEYRDGILLFELTNDMVWNKATEDTLGLQKFFTENQQNYMWKERLEGVKYTCSDEKIYKKVRKYVSKGKSEAFLIEKFNADNALALSTESILIERGSNELYDQIDWKKGIFDIKDDSGNQVFLKVNSVKDETPKEMNETLGAVISDYQDYLEKRWIASLTKKYPVSLNEGALKTLFQ
jgi:peptidyl-prolyl cis-trans isomerase SurA